MQTELFERLGTELKTRNYSPRTRKAYMGAVRRFVNYLEAVTASKHRALLYPIY